MIRNSSTNQFRAVNALNGQIRWCLSGTPIQNSLDDLSSLVTYLKVPVMSDPIQFKRHISRRKSKKDDDQKIDYGNLRILLRAICLRRPKTILPNSRAENMTYEVEFSATQRQEYEQLGVSTREKLELALAGNQPKKAHQAVLEALLRMRIFCNNGDRFGPPANNWCNKLIQPDEVGSLLQQSGDLSCFYCSCDVLSFDAREHNGSGLLTACHQTICNDCIGRYEEETRSRKHCPACKSKHSHVTQSPSDSTSQSGQSDRDFPPKMKALREDIERHKGESKR